MLDITKKQHQYILIRDGKAISSFVHWGEIFNHFHDDERKRMCVNIDIDDKFPIHLQAMQFSNQQDKIIIDLLIKAFLDNETYNIGAFTYNNSNYIIYVRDTPYYGYSLLTLYEQQMIEIYKQLTIIMKGGENNAN